MRRLIGTVMNMLEVKTAKKLNKEVIIPVFMCEKCHNTVLVPVAGNETVLHRIVVRYQRTNISPFD